LFNNAQIFDLLLSYSVNASLNKPVQLMKKYTERFWYGLWIMFPTALLDLHLSLTDIHDTVYDWLQVHIAIRSEQQKKMNVGWGEQQWLHVTLNAVGLLQKPAVP
jgi:hypothetical protein